MDPAERISEQMWRASVAASAVTVGGGALTGVGFLQRAPNDVLPAVVLIVGALVVLLGLLGWGRHAPSSASVFGFLLTVSLILAVNWVTQTLYFSRGTMSEPFTGDKLMALGVGLIAPPIAWVGLVTIGAAGIVPVAQYLSLSPVLRHQLRLEPWATIVYVVVAGAIYVYRLRLYQEQRRSARVEARVLLLQDFAQLLINAQHLANTKQIIENSVGLLRARHSEEEALVATMRRALAQVREVVHLFSLGDSYIDWQGMELPTSPAELEQRLKELIGKATRDQAASGRYAGADSSAAVER